MENFAATETSVHGGNAAGACLCAVQVSLSGNAGILQSGRQYSQHPGHRPISRQPWLSEDTVFEGSVRGCGKYKSHDHCR